MGAAARRRSARRAAGAGRPARAADGRGTGRALEPLAIPRGDVHGGMEVEAAVLGVERHGALDPRRVRVGADPRGTPPRAIAECRPAEERRPGEARQCSRLVRERIGVLVGERRPRQPEALEAPPYPGDDAAHVVVRGWRGRMEAQCAARRRRRERACERVIVEVNVHRPAEALHAQPCRSLRSGAPGAAPGGDARSGARARRRAAPCGRAGGRRRVGSAAGAGPRASTVGRARRPAAPDRRDAPRARPSVSPRARPSSRGCPSRLRAPSGCRRRRGRGSRLTPVCAGRQRTVASVRRGRRQAARCRAGAPLLGWECDRGVV